MYDTKGGSGQDGPIPTLAHLFFSILNPVLFKKLNRVGRVGRDGKILKPAPFTFDFCFYFLFFFIKTF